MENKIKSGIYGFVVGDALGVPVEFLNRKHFEKEPVTEMTGYGSHMVPAGTWSDDTSLTLAAMDSIMESNEIDYEDIMTKFCEWRAQCKYTATGVFFDIGIATTKALDKYEFGMNPLQCGGSSIRDNGNGSLMRILPFVYYSYYNQLNRQDEVELINSASAITHAHPISQLGCLIYNDYIKLLLNNNNKLDAFNKLKDNDYEKYYDKDVISYYDRILFGKLKDLSINEINSTGFVVDTLEASIWCNLNSKTYEEAVSKAVNLGNDTDTIGAVTGSISGIIYGYENIPNRWISKIQGFNYLENLTNCFADTLTKKNNRMR